MLLNWKESAEDIYKGGEREDLGRADFPAGFTKLTSGSAPFHPSGERQLKGRKTEGNPTRN